MTKIFSWLYPSEKMAAFRRAHDLIARDITEFWMDQSTFVDWHEPFFKVHEGEFAQSRWFIGGKINASWNCLDRHVEKGLADRTAIVFEDEKGHVQHISYKVLLAITKNIAATLHARGIAAGDRVVIYMPLVPEAVAAMLACARIGAVHTVVFGGFSKEALLDRIEDSDAKAVITAKSSQRKGALLQLGKTVEEALQDARSKTITTVLMFGDERPADARFVGYEEHRSFPPLVDKPVGFDAEHPLFILYTSGTTGKPKGIYHTTGGYLTQVVATTKWVFDPSPRDLYWCTADIGWITGHSYVVYGPLALGAQIFLYDGALNWPDSSRIYQLIERHQVSILYTAPTAIRMFMQAGEEVKGSRDLSSLRLLGSVGEPINPEAWHWYHRVFGNNQCAIIDSWWQTETGAMMIVPVEHISKPKPGSASKPFLGIKAAVVDEHGHKVATNKSGYLVIEHPWPSMARGIWGDAQRFHDTYFDKIPGVYFTGDGARIDEDGDFVISGRIDDVINVAGHRLGTAEIESALVSHPTVAEAAVVGISDPLTGQQPVAFVVLRNGHGVTSGLTSILREHVKQTIGSFARPAHIYFETVLPKTRSGKIMRRLLRARAAGEEITADTSTLDDATFVK